jgi:Undecaprenyl-phosphate glucose phosphotransferase
MYRFSALRRHTEYLIRLTVLWAAVVLLLMALIYLGGQANEYSRAWTLLWALGGWAALILSKFLAWETIRRLRGHLATRVAIFGQPSAAQLCARQLQDEGPGDVEVLGVFEARDFFGGPGAEDSRDIGVLESLAAVAGVDEIVLAMPGSDSLRLDTVLRTLGPRVVDIQAGFQIAGSPGGGRLVLVPVWRRPMAGLPIVVKRTIDVCVSAVLLFLVLPLMAIIAVLIKLDSPGPVLFRQQRFGINKKPFNLLKFRSMRHDSCADPSVPQARQRDPRVTKLGRFLRRTSLDEVPQLLNVLRGDMSLVGPRPHPTPLDDKYSKLIEGYVARHHVKPGITGWAQVHGWRGETDTLEKMERRIEYDVYYINHWSLLLDFQILLGTLAVVLRQQNAY